MQLKSASFTGLGTDLEIEEIDGTWSIQVKLEGIDAWMDVRDVDGKPFTTNTDLIQAPLRGRNYRLIISGVATYECHPPASVGGSVYPSVWVIKAPTITGQVLP